MRNPDILVSNSNLQILSARFAEACFVHCPGDMQNIVGLPFGPTEDPELD